MSGAPDELADYRAPAARALVLMHEVQLREFIDTWRRARDGGLVLPEVEDPDYASLDRLLLHMVGAARFYVTWTCERLGLDAPTIDAPPEVFADDATLDAYVDVLLAAWRAALATADPRSMAAASWPASQRWRTRRSPHDAHDAYGVLDRRRARARRLQH